MYKCVHNFSRLRNKKFICLDKNEICFKNFLNKKNMSTTTAEANNAPACGHGASEVNGTERVLVEGISILDMLGDIFVKLFIIKNSSE